MSTPTETAEEFTPLPAVGTAVATPALRTFQGKPLFPYDYGIRTLLAEAAGGMNDAHHWLLTLVFLLQDMQAGFEKYRKKGWDHRGIEAPLSEEDATVAAMADVLRSMDDRTIYQARVLRRTEKLGLKAAKEAIRLAEEILREANTLEAAEDTVEAVEADPVAA